MDNVIPFHKNRPCVELVEAGGECQVRVVEEDQELIRSFETEAYAVSFAEGQRIRLGLESVTRI